MSRKFDFDEGSTGSWSKLFKGILDFGRHKWTGYAFAFVLLVVAFKMNATSANCFVVGAWGVFVFTAFRTHPWGDSKRIRCLWTVIFAVALGYPMYRFLWSQTELPDVSLRFVNPTSPALVVDNLSTQPAQNIEYAVEVWNRELPERDAPLLIPISTFDFLNGKQSAGPIDIFSQTNALFKPGDLLYGTASIVLLGGRGHSFLVYIIWGQGGWYAEAPSVVTGEIIAPHVPFTKESRDKYLTDIESVPERSRIPIQEMVWRPAPPNLFKSMTIKP